MCLNSERDFPQKELTNMKLQKIFCFLLTLFLGFGVLAGCGQEPELTPTDVLPSSTAQEVESVGTSSGENSSVSSSGAASSQPSSWIPIFPVSPSPSSQVESQPQKPISVGFQSIYSEDYTGEDGYGKLWKNHFGKMAEQGILTSFAPMDSDVAVDTLYKDVLAGRKSADVYEVSLAMSHQLAVKRVLADVSASQTLNVKLFNNGGTRSNTIGGKTYGVALPANAQVPMILYNKAFLKQYAPDVDIPALIAGNKWNYETFREMAKQCTLDTNGDKKTDMYAIVSGNPLIQGVLFAGAGDYGVMKQGKITSTLAYEKDGKGKLSLEFAQELFKRDRSWKYYAKEEDQWTYFVNQKAAMTVLSSHEILEKAKGISFDYGIAPIPTQDQATACYGITESRVFVSPKTAQGCLDNIGKWLNAVAKINGNLLAYATRGVEETAATEYGWILNNTHANYSAGSLSDNAVSQVIALVTTSCKCSPERRFNTAHKVVQNEFDVFYAPLYEK